MYEIREFPGIPVKIPHYKILKRLGYNSKKNEAAPKLLSEIDEWISQAAYIIQLRAMTLRARIMTDAKKGRVSLLEHNLTFNSKKLSAFLKNSKEMLVMGITGGKEIALEINKLQAENEITRAVVIDAAASEIVDKGFEWLTTIYRNELLREKKILTTRRFSAGYGDLDIRYQADIIKLLELEKIGVEITESSILIPEKSVTAFCGIS